MVHPLGRENRQDNCSRCYYKPLNRDMASFRVDAGLVCIKVPTKWMHVIKLDHERHVHYGAEDGSD